MTGFIGIFWGIPNPDHSWSILADKSALAEAEPYGDFLTCSRGHYEVWNEWQQLNAKALAKKAIPQTVQDRFDAFVREFNAERPHEALDMKCPAEFYTPSARSYDGLPELTYPFHDRDVIVTACGRLCLHRKRINISTVLAGQRLGIKEVDEGIWLASFMHYDLGYFDLEQKTLQPLDNPFGTRLSPMS